MAKMTALKAPDLTDLSILVDPTAVMSDVTETSYTVTKDGVRVVVEHDGNGILTGLRVETQTLILFTTSFTITDISKNLAGLLDLLETSGAYAFRASLFDGDDQDIGSNFSDEFYGFAGNDLIKGGLGDDWLEGGEGADRLIGGEGEDTFIGGAGKDIVRGGAGSDFISGDPGKDLHDGGKGADVVDYRGIDEAIRVTLDGANPTIVRIGGTKSDTLESIEIILSGDGNDHLTGDGRANSLRGDEGDDRLFGEGGADFLNGGSGDDRLDGGNGADNLDGGMGSDRLTGGDGADVFVLRADLAADNVDRITDFAVGVDTIDLSHFIFAALAAADSLDPDFFQVGPADDGDDYIVYLPETGELFYDADGSGVGGGVLFARVGRNLALSGEDFVVS